MTKTDWDGSYAAVVEWARPFQPDCPGLGRTKLPRSGKLSKGRRWGLRLPGDYDYSNKKPRLLIKPSRLFDVQDVVRRWIRVRAALGQGQIASWQCKEAHVALVRVMHPGKERVSTYVEQDGGWEQLVVDEWNEVSMSRCSRPEWSELEMLAQLGTAAQQSASRVRLRTKRVRTLWSRLHVVERVLIPALIRLLPRVPITHTSPLVRTPGDEGQAWFRLTVEGFVFRFHRVDHQVVYTGYGRAGDWVFYAAYPEEDESLFEGRLDL